MNMKPLTYTKRRLWFHFVVYSFGNLLTYSAFGSLLGLQSSLNVVDSVGTKISALLFGSSVVSSVTILPLILRRLSPRKCLIVAEFSYAIYTLANLHPKPYILIPAAIFVGLGDAIIWTAMPHFFSFFAKHYQKITNSGKNEIATFSGYFFAIFQLSKIVGNSVTYTVLHAFRPDELPTNASDANDTNIRFCGSNDCQDPNLIQHTIDSYVPNRNATYIILGTMVAMYLTAMLLFTFLLPPMKSSGIPVTGTKRDKDSWSIKVRQELNFVLTTVKDILRQIMRLPQLLLTPGIFYGGFDFGFLTSELTRSYTSCVFGVSWVAIHLMIFGLSACAFSTLSGRFGSRLPALAFILFAAIVDAATYIYYLFWTPSANTQWSVIPAYILAGGMQGIWKSQSIAIQARTFSDTLDVGSAVWLFWWTLGICLQFAISPLACVGTKLIIQLILLAISVAGYVALEVLQRRRVSEDIKVTTDSEDCRLTTKTASEEHLNADTGLG